MANAIEIDMSSFNKFARDLRQADRELSRQLGRNLKAAGEIVAADARRRAGFSSRIPKSIVVRRAGAKIRVEARANIAPNAKPIEHGGKGGMFRHPVYGNRENWVSQEAKPFLRPAAEAGRAAVIVAAKRAIDDALAEVHSHG